MTFGESIRSVLSQYVTFSGRASRSEFWWFFLFLVLLDVVLRVLAAVLQFSLRYSGIGLLVFLALLLPYLAVSVRRLHDSERSGGWLAGLVLAYLGALLLLLVGLVGASVEGGPGDLADNFHNGDFVGFAVAVVLGGAALLGTIVMWAVQMSRRSTTGPNRYGPHPLLPSALPAPSPQGPATRSPWGGSDPPH
ncbi:hypothetical protein GCM10011519_22550 [Marmoricola endophyticus]|uniref:DUF805 domain-containing protein n=1 Tax=Marmoricola endophyticus TaxID=2040280 RepID=A0A917BJ45_9ACTN|nr:DUF805 domain-containing protein [Marmoricola endophyticus]GGF48042.1 hypothetical protein GCM10011519_22550 [Marmoricola endophyticus]